MTYVVFYTVHKMNTCECVHSSLLMEPSLSLPPPRPPHTLRLWRETGTLGPRRETSRSGCLPPPLHRRPPLPLPPLPAPGALAWSWTNCGWVGAPPQPGLICRGFKVERKCYCLVPPIFMTVQYNKHKVIFLQSVLQHVLRHCHKSKDFFLNCERQKT